MFALTSVHGLKSFIRCSHEEVWLNQVKQPFPFQPYYANGNQLMQAKTALVVPNQLDRLRTSLPGSLHNTVYPITINMLLTSFPLFSRRVIVLKNSEYDQNKTGKQKLIPSNIQQSLNATLGASELTRNLSGSMFIML